MNPIRNSLAIAWKELQVIWKDKGALVILFLLPALLSSFLGGLPLSSARAEGGLDEPELMFDIYVVNEDQGEYGKQIVSSLEEVDILTIKKLASATAADQRMADREGDAAVIIPADFSQNIDAYEPAEVQIIVDPTQPESINVISGVVGNVASGVNLWGEISHGVHTFFDEAGILDAAPAEMTQALEAQSVGIIMTQLYEMRAEPAITVNSENLAGVETVDEISFLLSAFQPAFAVMFAFFLMGTISVSIFTEKEQGSFRRLLAAPIRRGTILAGKMLAYMVIVAMQVLVLFALGNVFGMPLGNSPVGLVLITLALAIAVTATGMLLAAFARNAKQADSLGMLLGFILAGISGAIPVSSLILAFRDEGILGTLARLTPHAHALEGYLRLLAEGAGIVDILPQVGILLGMSLLFYLLALWRFRFD
jgi:ABC-2 type transport system permease protein